LSEDEASPVFICAEESLTSNCPDKPCGFAEKKPLRRNSKKQNEMERCREQKELIDQRDYLSLRRSIQLHFSQTKTEY